MTRRIKERNVPCLKKISRQNVADGVRIFTPSKVNTCEAPTEPREALKRLEENMESPRGTATELGSNRPISGSNLGPASSRDQKRTRERKSVPLMPLWGKLVCTACCRLVNYYNCEVPAIFRLALVHQRYMPTYRPADTEYRWTLAVLKFTTTGPELTVFFVSFKTTLLMLMPRSMGIKIPR